jgi:mono/diheme cytochrome c family protein
MMRGSSGSRWVTFSLGLPAIAAVVGLMAASTNRPSGNHDRQVDQAVVLRGRQLVIEHACGGCHGGADPASDAWLTGYTGKVQTGIQDFLIGPFHTYARNLTPDDVTGLGQFSERQIFNALRYGLRPGDTPDIEITSNTPGKGNFPEHPSYLAPPMPWTSWRYMPDADLRAIATYLKHGLKPVRHKVPDSEGPPDFWAGYYVPDTIGTYPPPEFPTTNETMPPQGTVDMRQVLRGRQVVMEHACGDCHGGLGNPAAKDWLIGMTSVVQDFLIGPCAADSKATPCFHGRPRNLTPDNATGVGRYSERQIFNALRFGLSPRATPDVEITSNTPGQGNFPAQPTYLSVAMPWTYWRHMSDADLWAVAAYLKHGLKPVSHHVDDSDAPPDHWASAYTVEEVGSYPAPKFPTVHEVGGKAGR